MSEYAEVINIINGATTFKLSDLRLEGLRFVHVLPTERFQFVEKNLMFPKVPYTDASDVSIASRYAAGIMMAPCTKVYAAATAQVVGGETGLSAGHVKLINAFCAITIAAGVASGTGVSSSSSTVATAINFTEHENEFTPALEAAFGGQGTAEVVKSLMMCSAGYSILNESVASWLHTNHHNGSSARFERGILSALLDLDSVLGTNVFPTGTTPSSVDAGFARRAVAAAFRTLVHDIDHQNVVHLAMDPSTRAKAKWPVTDFDKFSYFNAPAGVSNISGAYAILENAGNALHAEYLSLAAALRPLAQEIAPTNGMSRYKYSPYYMYLVGTPTLPLPSDAAAALASAGALAVISSDADLRDRYSFLRATAYQAISVRKESTPAAEALVRKRIEIKGLASEQYEATVKGAEAVKRRVAMSVDEELAGLVL